MSEARKVTTASGREVKKTGMNDSKKSALAKLREARSGNIKRTDQYEVSVDLPFYKRIGRGRCRRV